MFYSVVSRLIYSNLCLFNTESINYRSTEHTKLSDLILNNVLIPVLTLMLATSCGLCQVIVKHWCVPMNISSFDNKRLTMIMCSYVCDVKEQFCRRTLWCTVLIIVWRNNWFKCQWIPKDYFFYYLSFHNLKKVSHT